MGIEIFYFSGTGNSLYVANALQNEMPGSKLTPMIGLLNEGDVTVRTEVIGLVFPVHGFTLPYTVKDFIKTIELNGADYIFSVATKGGSPDQVMDAMDTSLRAKGKRLSAHFSITMFTNDCMFRCPYDHQSFAPTDAMIAEMEDKIENNVGTIANVVRKRETHLEGDEDYRYEVSRLVQNASILFLKVLGGNNIKGSFYADHNCVGCGVCERVCPADRIEIVDGSPNWKEDIYCHRCYACLNYCPSQAIQIASKWYKPSLTEKQDRYSHPFATVREIEAQKSA